MKRLKNLLQKIDELINNRKIFFGVILPIILIGFLYSLATVYVNSYNITNSDKIYTFAILESSDSYYIELIGEKFEILKK